jgi:hypothetical protein
VNTTENSIVRRVARLERELVLWRVLALVAATFTVAFAGEKAAKEIRFVSADGRQTVTLSSVGLELLDRGKSLGRIGFETIGDGDEQEAIINLSGDVHARSVFVEEGRNRLALTAERVGFLQNGAVRTAMTPDGIYVQDAGGHSRISVTTFDKSIGGLDFVEDGKLILGLGPFGKFRVDNPPRRDAGAIHIGDFGREPKSLLLTASESEVHGVH